MSNFLRLRPKAPKIKVPAKVGDVVLITPGAFSDPHGRIHWWQFVMNFGRPDGTVGMSNWLVASHKYAARHNFEPETFQVIGDLTWQDRFVSPDGGVDAGAIEAFAGQGAHGQRNPIEDETYGGGDIAQMHDDLRHKNRAVIKGIHVEVKRTPGRKYDRFDLYIQGNKVWTGEAASIDPLNIAGGTFEAFVEHALQQAGFRRRGH